MQIKITPRTLGGTEFTAQPARLHLGAQNAEGVDRLVFQLPAEWAGCSVTLHIRHSDGTLAAPLVLDAAHSAPVGRSFTGWPTGQWMLAATDGSGYTAYTRPGRYDVYDILPTDGTEEEPSPSVYEQFIAQVSGQADAAVQAAQNSAASEANAARQAQAAADAAERAALNGSRAATSASRAESRPACRILCARGRHPAQCQRQGRRGGAGRAGRGRAACPGGPAGRCPPAGAVHPQRWQSGGGHRHSRRPQDPVGGHLMFTVLDVSRWQGRIDWDTVKASGRVHGVMLRALGSRNGTPYIDPMFETNYSACIRLGIPVGVYYYSCAVTAPQRDAELALLHDALRGKRLQLPAAIDVEDARLRALTPDALSALVAGAARQLEHWGLYAMVYTYTHFADTALHMDTLAPFDLWLADYRGKRPARRHGMWQYTSRGRVPGISGPVDLSRTEKDYPALLHRAGLDRTIL